MPDHDEAKQDNTKARDLAFEAALDERRDIREGRDFFVFFLCSNMALFCLLPIVFEPVVFLGNLSEPNVETEATNPLSSVLFMPIAGAITGFAISFMIRAVWRRFILSGPSFWIRMAGYSACAFIYIAALIFFVGSTQTVLSMVAVFCVFGFIYWLVTQSLSGLF